MQGTSGQSYLEAVVLTCCSTRAHTSIRLYPLWDIVGRYFSWLGTHEGGHSHQVFTEGGQYSSGQSLHHSMFGG